MTTPDSGMDKLNLITTTANVHEPIDWEKAFEQMREMLNRRPPILKRIKVGSEVYDELMEQAKPGTNGYYGTPVILDESIPKRAVRPEYE